MKEKILILANNSSGLYSFRKELIRELAKKYCVWASTPDDGRVSQLEEIPCKVMPISMDRRGVNPIKDMGLMVRYFRLLAAVKPNFVMTYTIKPNIYGGIVCRLKKIPYGVNITGLGTAFQKEGFLKKIVTLLYKVALKDAKTVYFENAQNRDLFLELKIVKQEQCCLLHGAGVNLQQYTLLEYPKESEKLRFLFIGRVMQEKGVDELFSAMKMLHKENKNCVLDVVGSLEENYSEKIAVYEKEGWLTYHGFQEDVHPFIEKAHCFVLPSWHEGMANTNLECAASGRPVITSDIWGCKEAVIENETGFLCRSQDALSLYEAMKKMAELSGEQREQMGCAGRVHMEAVFDRERVVQETMERL